MRTRSVASDSGGAFSSRFNAALRGMQRVLPAGPVPTFEAVFAGATRLPSSFTFTRASNATMFDLLGRLVWAPANLCVYSEDFAQAGWVVVNATKTTGITDPLGGTTGCTVTATSNGGNFQIVPAAVIGTNYTVTFWIRRRSGVGDVFIRPVENSTTLVAVTDSWEQYSASNTATSVNLRIGVQLAVAGDAIDVAFGQAEITGVDSPKSYNATAGSAYYGPRFDYNPATLSALGLLIEESRTNIVPASALTTSWAPTNLTSSAGDTLVGWSSLRLTAISSAGASNNANSGAMVGSLTALASYTESVLVKLPAGSTAQFVQILATTGWAGADAYANFDLIAGTVGTIGTNSTGSSITDLGGGVFRLTHTCPANAAPGAATSTVIVSIVNSASALRLPVIPLTTSMSIDVALPQLEAGTFATSIIPTFGAAATRAGDVCDLVNQIPYNASGMVLYTEWSRTIIPTVSGSYSVAYFGSSTDALNQVFGFGVPAQQRLDVSVASVAQAQLSGPSGVVGTIYKCAARLAPNDFIGCYNGVLTSADVSGSMPASLPSTRKAIGRGLADSTTQLNGHMRGLRVYLTPLTNLQLQALTV